jgi:hypothetical protein
VHASGCLDGASPSLGRQAFLSHGSPRHRQATRPWQPRRALEERKQSYMRHCTVLDLRTPGSAHDDQDSVGRDASAAQRPQSVFHPGWKRRRGDIETQLDRRFFSSRVLSTRTHGPDETFLDLVILEADAVGHS